MPYLHSWLKQIGHKALRPFTGFESQDTKILFPLEYSLGNVDCKLDSKRDGLVTSTSATRDLELPQIMVSVELPLNIKCIQPRLCWFLADPTTRSLGPGLLAFLF